MEQIEAALVIGRFQVVRFDQFLRGFDIGRPLLRRERALQKLRGGIDKTRPDTSSGYALAKSLAIRPPQECPTRTYGPVSLAAISRVCRSTTPCCAVVGCRTGVESVRVLSFQGGSGPVVGTYTGELANLWEDS